MKTFYSIAIYYSFYSTKRKEQQLTGTNQQLRNRRLFFVYCATSMETSINGGKQFV